MTYVLVGLAVPLACLLVLLGMATYELRMLDETPGPARELAGVDHVAALTAGLRTRSSGPAEALSFERLDSPVP